MNFYLSTWSVKWLTRIRMWSQKRVGHCSFSMNSFSAMLGPYFKSCEGCDYGNKTNVFANPVSEYRRVFISVCCSFRLLWEIFVHCILNQYLVMRSILLRCFFNVFAKAFLFSFGYFKELLTLDPLLEKTEDRVLAHGGHMYFERRRVLPSLWPESFFCVPLFLLFSQAFFSYLFLVVSFY